MKTFSILSIQFCSENLIKLFNNYVNDLTIEVVKIGLFVHSEKLIKLFNRSSRGESLRSTLSPLGIGNVRI